ncbi:MAG TPA: hypothetical protein VJA21_22045 [Verrucomicrobiae bacterium]
MREQINRLILDGLTYKAIIATLGEAGKGLNKDNLSRWRKADHQDWLSEQRWLSGASAKSPARPEVEEIGQLLAELDGDQIAAHLRKHAPRLFNALTTLAISTIEPPFTEPRPHDVSRNHISLSYHEPLSTKKTSHGNRS